MSRVFSRSVEVGNLPIVEKKLDVVIVKLRSNVSSCRWLRGSNNSVGTTTTWSNPFSILQDFNTKKLHFAEVALMVEHLTCNQGVAGSTPVLGSNLPP